MTEDSDNVQTAEATEGVRPRAALATSDGGADGVPPPEPSLEDPNHPWRRAASILAAGACRLARARMAEKLKARGRSSSRSDKIEAGVRRGREQARRKAPTSAR